MSIILNHALVSNNIKLERISLRRNPGKPIYHFRGLKLGEYDASGIAQVALYLREDAKFVEYITLKEPLEREYQIILHNDLFSFLRIEFPAEYSTDYYRCFGINITEKF